MFILSIGREIKLNDESFEEISFDFLKGRVFVLFKKNKYVFNNDAGLLELKESIFECENDSGKVNNSIMTLRLDKKESKLTVNCNTEFLKPIYYHLSPEGRFICSSHIALLEKAGVPLEENNASLPEYLLYRCVMPPLTLFKSINILGFGEELSVYLASDKPKITINSLTDLVPSKIDNNTNRIDKIFEILKHNLSILYNRRKNVATILSGGMDSSLLVLLSKNILHQNDTYSTDYPLEFGHVPIEREYALSASRVLGTNHILHDYSKKEYFHGLIDAIAYAEMPVHQLQSIALFNLFKEGVKPEHKLLLCGLGSDDIFGSQNHEKVFEILTNKTIYHYLPFKVFFKALFLFIFSKFKKGCIPRRYFTHCVYSHGDINSYLWTISSYGNLKWIEGEFGIKKKEILQSRIKKLKNYSKSNILDLMTYHYLFGSLALSQMIWNRLAEKQGLVLYFPFLDLQILRVSLGLSWVIKLSKNKYAIRHICEKLNMPKLVLERQKSGFGFDLRSWGGPHGILLKLILRFSDEKLAEKLSMELDDLEDYADSQTLWSILNYCIWKKLFIEKQSADKLHMIVSEVLSGK